MWLVVSIHALFAIGLTASQVRTGHKCAFCERVVLRKALCNDWGHAFVVVLLLALLFVHLTICSLLIWPLWDLLIQMVFVGFFCLLSWLLWAWNTHLFHFQHILFTPVC